MTVEQPQTTTQRGDHPNGVTPAHHFWLAYRAGGPGWRICKWCSLTKRPEEQAR